MAYGFFLRGPQNVRNTRFHARCVRGTWTWSRARITNAEYPNSERIRLGWTRPRFRIPEICDVCIWRRLATQRSMCGISCAKYVDGGYLSELPKRRCGAARFFQIEPVPARSTNEHAPRVNPCVLQSLPCAFSKVLQDPAGARTQHQRTRTAYDEDDRIPINAMWGRATCTFPVGIVIVARVREMGVCAVL